MKRRNCYQKSGAFLTAMLILMIVFSAVAKAEVPGKLKSVTYVSDAWVINFWNTESDHMEEELAQIAADGFNSIVLAVPWREFQPETAPVSYNSYAFAKLDRVMQAAQAQGLGVMLRVGYTWDHYDREQPTMRFRRMLKDESLRLAWLEYVGKLYQSVCGYDNFCGGFMTWEDFWNYMEDAPGLYAARSAGVKEAGQIGFQDYLKKHYTLAEVQDYFGPKERIEDFASVGIPARNSPAYLLLYEFYDEYLMELLREAQQVFPDLSMEVRLDVDPVKGRDGSDVGAGHFKTFPCGEASYTSLMYSVSMGQKADSLITAAEAVDMTEKQLRLVRAHNGGKPIYIDQLLYTDSTPGFEHNARLLEDERSAYLTMLPGVLRSYTNGYAVWSYRNYANNPVYNCQFALGDRGWETSRTRIVQRGGSNQARLQAGGSISQEIGHWISGKTRYDNHVRFTADSERPVWVSVRLGSRTEEVLVDKETQFDLNFGTTEYERVEFRARDEVYLDNICVYNFVQDGQVYDLDGNGLSCLEGLRTLNRLLDE